MKRCPNCNLTFDDDNAFCTEDGTTLELHVVAEHAPSRFSVSLEQPTQVVERPAQIFAPPQAFPMPGAAPDNSKWLYLIIGGLIAIVITMGAGFLLLRDDNKKEDGVNLNRSNRANERTTESSTISPNANGKSLDEPIDAATNRPITAANIMPTDGNSKRSEALLSRNFTRTYSGTADNDGISMELRRSGSSLGGRVFSRRSATDISVSGNIDDNGAFEMNEYSDIGVNTGVYRGRINTDGTMNGTWSKPDGSKPRPFFLRAN